MVAESSVPMMPFFGAAFFAGSRILTPSAASCSFHSSSRRARSRIWLTVLCDVVSQPGFLFLS